MLHASIYELFKSYHSHYAEKAVAWSPFGENCILIRTVDICEYVFTFHSHDNWTLETIQSYKKRTERR